MQSAKTQINTQAKAVLFLVPLAHVTQRREESEQKARAHKVVAGSICPNVPFIMHAKKLEFKYYNLFDIIDIIFSYICFKLLVPRREKNVSLAICT